MTQPDHLEKPSNRLRAIGMFTKLLSELTFDDVSRLFPEANQSASDSKKVTDALATRLGHEMNLCIGQTATLESAEAFLQGRDPVFTSPQGALSHVPGISHRMASLHFTAGMTAGNILLLNAMFPGEFSDKTTYPQVLKSLWQKHYLKDKIDLGHGEMGATAMLEHYDPIRKLCYTRLLISNILGVPLGNDSLKKLVKASDAHTIAAATLHLSAATDTPEGREVVLSISSRLRRNSTLLRQYIAHNALLNGPNEIDTKRLAIGLREQWSVVSGVLDQETRRDNPSHAKAGLQHMVDTLRFIFLDGKALEAMSVGEAKGLLHELLWMVDANMLALSNPGYSDISVHPSRLYSDHPMINNPDLYHGIDYVVSRGVDKRMLDMTGHICAHSYQLKSGSQDGKTYHPSITLAIDEDFRGDLDKRRLITRLNMYSKLITSGFQDSHEMKRFLGDGKRRPYLLNSVREALEQVRSCSK